MNVCFDCKYYQGSKPCKFHKHNGQLCENCTKYKKTEKKILIIKLDALGDVLRTTSILPSLHDKYDNLSIIWVTRKNALELLGNNIYIQRIYAVEYNYLEYILNETFDEGICLDADPLSASILALAKCKVKRGFVANKEGQVIPYNENSQQWFLMGINDRLKKENRITYQQHMYNICNLKSEIAKPQISINTDNKKFAQSFC